MWYADARKRCFEISADTGVPFFQVAGVLAALSPRNRWETNIKDTVSFCYAWSNGERMPRASTYTRNRETAWLVLALNFELRTEVARILGGRKVKSFYACLIAVTDSCCIDTWAIRAATRGKVDAVTTDKVYDEVQAAYIKVAHKLGLEPRIFQAIIWVHIRSMS